MHADAAAAFFRNEELIGGIQSCQTTLRFVVLGLLVDLDFGAVF